MKIIIKRSQFPQYLKSFKQLKGICIGQCVDKEIGLAKKHMAHAHCYVGGSYQGWICLRHKRQLREKFTLLHEVAHLLANTHPDIPFHGKKWKQAVVSIGGTFKPFTYKYGNRYGTLVVTNFDYTHRNNKF